MSSIPLIASKTISITPYGIRGRKDGRAIKGDIHIPAANATFISSG